MSQGFGLLVAPELNCCDSFLSKECIGVYEDKYYYNYISAWPNYSSSWIRSKPKPEIKKTEELEASTSGLSHESASSAESSSTDDNAQNETNGIQETSHHTKLLAVHTAALTQNIIDKRKTLLEISHSYKQSQQRENEDIINSKSEKQASAEKFEKFLEWYYQQLDEQAALRKKHVSVLSVISPQKYELLSFARSL